MPSADLPDFYLCDKSDFYMATVMQATYFTGVKIPDLLAHLETAGRSGREVVEFPETAF